MPTHPDPMGALDPASFFCQIRGFFSCFLQIFGDFMGRFFVLFLISLLSFSVVFGVGYFLFVPQVSIPMMEESFNQMGGMSMGDMEPAFDEENPESGELIDPGEAPEFN